MHASRSSLFFLFPVLLACLLACGCKSPSAPEDRPPPSAPPGGGGDACSSLTRTHCLQSPDCTLEKVGDNGTVYRCRPEVAPCETGIRQSDFMGSGDGIPRAEQAQAACDARSGCRFEPGKCYCHCRGYGKTSVADGSEADDCACACGGGPPPTCTASGT